MLNMEDATGVRLFLLEVWMQMDSGIALSATMDGVCESGYRSLRMRQDGMLAKSHKKEYAEI